MRDWCWVRYLSMKVKHEDLVAGLGWAGQIFKTYSGKCTAVVKI